MRTLLAFATLAVTLALSGSAFADLPTEDRVEDAREAVARAPARLAPRLRLVELLVRAREPQEALREIGLLRALHPEETESALWRARALVALRREAEAEDALGERLDADPRDARARSLRASLREARGELPGALDDYEAALARGPAVELYLGRARVLERLGDGDGALEGLRAGLDAAGGAAVLRAEAFALARRQGQPAVALALVEELLDARPNATRWWVMRAAALSDLGRDAEARATLTRALEGADRMVARRGSALALQERGRVLLALERRADARRDLRQALRRAPSLVDARRLLAVAGSDR